MKLSIIIPIYNSEKYIRRCIESVINQLYKEDELILINDGSTDKSGIICDEYKQKYKQIKVIHQENSGVSVARNNGLKIAAGEYVSFIDVDDLADKNMIFQIKKYLKQDYDIILFDYIQADTKKAKFYQVEEKPQEYIYDKNSRDLFIKCNFLGKSIVENRNINMRAVWGKVYRRKFLEENHIFFEEDVKIGEDMLYMLEIYSLFEKAKYIGTPIYHYFFYNIDSATNRYKPDFQDIVIKYIKKMELWLEEYPKYVPYHANYRLNDIILYMKYDFFNEKNKEITKVLKQRMKKILGDGLYREYYKIANKNDLLKEYSFAKRIVFWSAIHNVYPVLKLIYNIKYKILYKLKI